MNAPERSDSEAAFERRIGYQFNDPALLRRALTHGSLNDTRRARVRDNERLEFLGDRILGLVTAEHLFRTFSDLEEDGLAPRLNALVNRNACAEAARVMELGPVLRLGKSEEEQGGRDKDAILADACEAVIAALYLDGGLDAARGFILNFWANQFEAVTVLRKEPKTALHEWAAARKAALHYEVVNRTGPEHAPLFVVEAHVEGFAPVRGEGGSKREAERAAAAAFLQEHAPHG